MSDNAVTANDQRRVLIVEDDEHIGYLLEYIIQREGFATMRAADGRQAERIIESEPPPALVVLDIMLPYLSGIELISKIRSRHEWADVPVMMLSTKSSEQDIVTALDAGASDYVVKPFQPNELLARLRRLLRG